RIPYGAETAIEGSWQPGPGKALFYAAKHSLGEMAIIAEDLGIITPEVTALREVLGFPGMAILQFAFDDDPGNAYLPHNYTSPGTVVYTGTHDNDTTKGWYDNAPDATKDKLRRYLGVSGQDIAWDMIRLAFSSVASCAILPLQDIFSLGTEARTNTPGTATGNWRFRCQQGVFTAEAAHGLRYLASMYNRAKT
ncbi:MAG: 4-alpha-glucanotransferase, partial [Defluviitaleaceae bacterium]|nr:4-alpha-glucanotransferase [Defluviitaleaceae bacterium]